MGEPRGHVVAMGGGGFSMEETPLLDDFILGLSPRQPARVCFVPTASADSPSYLVRFYRALSRRCVASNLTLNGGGASPPRSPLSTGELADFIAAQDVFYVGGGNTANLLAQWRVHGVDRLLREAWERGAVLAGVSAGMICWFQGSVTDSFGPLAPLHDGLGFLPGSACPHFDGEGQRRPTYHALVATGGLPAGYAADDGAALCFTGRTLVEVVSSRPKAAAYRVERDGDRAVEERLPTRFLGQS